ncbi:MAG: SURF1 family protein [Pseudomonadota bacterium]
MNSVIPLRKLCAHYCWRFIPALATLLLVPFFIACGQWQWNKASIKGNLQVLLDERTAQAPYLMSGIPVVADTLRYRKVLVRGVYEPQYQILLDNRIHQEQAGYHVLTPLRIEGSTLRVLVNRGWVPALPEHRNTPEVATPSGVVEVSAMAVVPGKRFFTLAKELEQQTVGQRQSVWQNLDMDRYAKQLGLPLQPVLLLLAPESSAGGFARDWPRPDERLEQHLSYALQWWGFAAATLLFFLFVTVRSWRARRLSQNSL